MCARDATESIEQLLQSLEQLEQEEDSLKDKSDDLTFLRDILKTSAFHSLLNVHNTVSKVTTESYPNPLSPNALTLANIVSYDAENESSPEEKELFELLSSPHLHGLLVAHDKVANKEYPLQSVVAMDTGSKGKGREVKVPIRVVHLVKKNHPLGATVRRDKEGNIIVSRVLSGSLASRSGMLHPGDIVHEINGTKVQGWSIDEVATFMQTQTGNLAFKVTPANDGFTSRRRSQESFYIRSLVTYDPQLDRNHPCREAGLAFDRGTMLEVVDQDDSEWWQALREGDSRDKVGLIPSKKSMEWIRAYSSGKKKQYGDKKKSYRAYDGEMLGREMVTYEEMVKIDPQQDRPRPIVLIAPRNGPLNLEDLKQKIVSENPAKFGIPIPHTSCSPRSGEVNGEHYHFVQLSRMERDILNGEMIEYVMINNHYYGTSTNSIRSIINSGRTCLLVLNPQAIKLVRSSELRPFIVYFSTPTADYMKKHWVPSKKIKDSLVLDIVRQATHLEKNYTHYFDHFLPYDDMDSAVSGVVNIANSLRTNQQWVPANWLR